MASDNQTKVELGLILTVAEIEVDLRATVGGPEGWTFTGAAAFGETAGRPDVTLSTLIARLQGEHGEGPWFEKAPVDVGLTGLKVSYRAEPTAFAVRSDIAVMLDAGPRFDLAFLLARTIGAGAGDPGLLVALCTTSPIDLRTIIGSDTGLIGRFLGDIQLDRLGVYYASEEIEVDGDLVDPRSGGRAAFAKGPSFSARFGDGRSFTDLALPPPEAEPSEAPVVGPARTETSDKPKPPKPKEEKGGPLRFWKPLDKTIGPLKFKRIGGEWEGGKLGILLDASVSLAGLSVGLAGLAVRVEPSRLPKLKFEDLEFGLDGLELAFSRGPVSISGALLKTMEEGRVGYAGQAMIRLSRFSIAAIGGYTTTREGEPAFFIFGAFIGTLGGPPCFVVEGIAAGFGYNRGITLPEIE
jgi:hypothetical protein